MLIVGSLGVIGGLAYLYFKSKQAAASTSTQTPMLTPPAQGAPTTAAPQSHHFGTNDSGSAVTLHPGDSVSFTFPNDPNAASTKGSDWFYTIAPTLNFAGRTTQVVSGQLQETDTFIWGGGAGGTIPVTAQFLPANNPALPTAGPMPPVAAPQTGASTFVFTINTVSP
jgi:hypothetical protein